LTEFKAELRHRCRNSKCRSKLPEPVENERRAFCAKCCFASHYRHRCLVCEQPFKRKRENQHVCSRPPFTHDWERSPARLVALVLRCNQRRPKRITM